MSLQPAKIPRRDFVRAVAGAVGGLAIAGRFDAPAAAARQATFPKRINVAGLTAVSPILKSYAAAITAMRQLFQSDPKDPRGWIFQANMHGTPQGEPVLDPAWNGCQHGTRWFFPWHRGYLYYFERIVRKMANDPSFTLPYWKWDGTASLALPQPFREDPGSPLYDDTRGTNDGTPLSDRLAVDLAAAQANDLFDPSADGRQGFTLDFDGGPHGRVHVETGGNMGSVPIAARDAVFFLHHANVDRLWNRWLDSTQHVNPADDEWLLNQWDQGQTVRFRYYDENAAGVELTTAEVLTMTAAAVRYDDEREAMALVRAAPQLAQRISPPVTVASASKEAYALTNEPLAVPLALGAPGARKLTATLQTAGKRQTAARKPRIFLVIQGISARAAAVPVHYNVYLRAKDRKADETGEYIGNINFFGRAEPAEQGHVHGHTSGGLTFDRKFEITDALAKLSKQTGQPIQDVTISLEPVLNGKRTDKAALQRTQVQGVTFERVVMQTVE
jgi:tyrosinase